MDNKKLFWQAIGKFLLGVIAVGLLLFVPAWSFHYWQGWLLMGILFVPMFCAGLNWRFGWCVLPDWAVWASAGLFLFCYLLYAEVLRENTYLSRTIEVQENQKVIDTGLYGVVRHPMYMATTVLFLAMPLVLASPVSFLIMLLYLPLIARRIKNEEAVLEEGLDGYKEYKQRVKYKVIPYIW